MKQFKYRKTSDVKFIKSIDNQHDICDEITPAKKECKLFNHILIQTNSLCTRKCYFCYYGTVTNRISMGSKLATDVIFHIVDQLEDIDYRGRIGFYSINEPLTDPRIFEFIAYAKMRIPKAWNMLITNGDLLTNEKLECLFESGLDNLFISLYDTKTIAKIQEMEKTATSLFKKVHKMNFTNYIFEDNRGGNVFVDNMNTYNNPCERIYQILHINPDGWVTSCFSDFYGVNKFGHVQKKSIIDIWRGKKFMRFRRELDKGNRLYSKLCEKCNYPGYGGYFVRPK